MNIQVTDRNPIFACPVTVQTGYIEDGEFILENCDHAGAEEELVDHGYGPDSDERRALVCDKCEEVTAIEDEESYD